MAVGRQPLRARPPSLPLPLLLLSLCSSALAFGDAGQSGAGTPLSRFFEYPRTALGGFNLQHATFTSVDDCARLCLGDPLVRLACCMVFVLLAVYPMDSHSTRKARGVGSACCVALLTPPHSFIQTLAGSSLAVANTCSLTSALHGIYFFAPNAHLLIAAAAPSPPVPICACHWDGLP